MARQVMAPSSPARPRTVRPRQRALPLVLAGAALLATALPARSQEAGYGQTVDPSSQGRDAFDGTPAGRGESILDSTNPIDLMNRIRRRSALDDATPPGTAVDQALREFETQSAAPGAAPPAAAEPAASAPVWSPQQP